MKDDDLLYVLPAAATSVFASITKMVQYPLIESRESILKSYHEGLYHITSDDAADKIMNSQELYASSRFASYGLHKRCFFFAGVPDFENVCLNTKPGQTLTAVRVKLPYERLAEFDRREINDGAITYKGNLSLEDAVVEKVRLGLKEKDGDLYYSQISEEEYQNYKLNLSDDKMKIVQSKISFKLHTLAAGLRREFELFKENARNFIKDESSGLNITTRQDYIEVNSDLFEKTDELPVIQVSNEHEEAIEMFKSLSDSSSQSYNVGNMVTSDKNAVKAELLKGLASSVVCSLNHGQGLSNNNDVVVSNMSDKDIADVLYTNMCNGKIEECFNLLDNSVVLFSVCKTYVGNKNNDLNNANQIDPRVQFLSQEIDSYYSNLNQNNYSYN